MSDTPKRTEQEMDDGNRPYKFTLASTGEVFVIGFMPMPGVTMIFENLESFQRFVDDGQKACEIFGPKILRDAGEILRRKQDGTAEWRDRFFPAEPNDNEEEEQ